MAGPGIEDHDAHRGGVDQGLQVGPRPLLGPVPAGVGDRRPGLGREQRQDLLVLAGELLPAFLVGQIEVAHLPAPVSDRRPQEAPR